MDLVAKIKHKNDSVLVKNFELQQKLSAQVNASSFSSFFFTFVAGPFVAGVAVRYIFGSRGPTSRQLIRFAFPILRLWPFL